MAPNVYKLVMSVLEDKCLPAKLNDTFLVLIPEIDKPELPSQFHPIGLCNVIYKIITKAIINKIKILPNITSNTQTRFVPRKTDYRQHFHCSGGYPYYEEKTR